MGLLEHLYRFGDFLDANAPSRGQARHVCVRPQEKEDSSVGSDTNDQRRACCSYVSYAWSLHPTDIASLRGFEGSNEPVPVSREGERGSIEINP